MKLNFWSPILGTSGYASHGRNLARALVQQGVDLGVDALDYNPAHAHQVPDEIKQCLNKGYDFEPTVGNILPPYFPIKTSDHLPAFFGYVVFEGTKMQQDWVDAINHEGVTKILVPSTHVMDACRNSGVHKHTAIVPHGFDEKVFHPEVQPNKELREDHFKFLYVGGWKDGARDRKGLDIALRAFADEFKHDEKAVFYAKINGAYQNPLTVQQNLKEIGLRKAEERAEIVLLFNTVTDDVLAKTYKAADVLVAPSKAEAFNMPVLEAMACGTPSIVTNYGGPQDYVNSSNGYLLDIDGMAPATGERHIYQNAEWSVPSYDHLRRLMRHCFDNRDEVKTRGANAAEDVKNRTWADTAKTLLQVVGDVGA